MVRLGTDSSEKTNSSSGGTSRKNYVAGNQVITHNHTTSVFNQDQTKTIRQCAVSGKQAEITHGHECPRCARWVYKDCFRRDEMCCENCYRVQRNEALEQYEARAKECLSDGVIDMSENDYLTALGCKLGLTFEDQETIVKKLKQERDKGFNLTNIENQILRTAEREIIQGLAGDEKAMEKALKTIEGIAKSHSKNLMLVVLWVSALAVTGRWSRVQKELGDIAVLRADSAPKFLLEAAVYRAAMRAQDEVPLQDAAQKFSDSLRSLERSFPGSPEYAVLQLAVQLDDYYVCGGISRDIELEIANSLATAKAASWGWSASWGWLSALLSDVENTWRNPGLGSAHAFAEKTSAQAMLFYRLIFERPEGPKMQRADMEPSNTMQMPSESETIDETPTPQPSPTGGESSRPTGSSSPDGLEQSPPELVAEKPVQNYFWGGVLIVCLVGFLILSQIYFGESFSKNTLDVKQILDEDKSTLFLIPEGIFEMGSTEGKPDEKPIRSVNLSSYFIGETEVTFGQWKSVCAWAEVNGYEFSSNAKGASDKHPVTNVSWYDAVKWCNAKSEKEKYAACYRGRGGVYRKGLEPRVDCDWTGEGYRLPTEAEWEKAARGRLNGKAFPNGNSLDTRAANFSSTGTKLVGMYSPNGFGLRDMAGNVWEWVWDYHAGSYDVRDVVNPRGPSLGAMKVLRGGGFSGSAEGCRVSDRNGLHPYESSGNLGLRVVRRPKS